MNRRLLLPALLLLSGCAYYNGMYNANKLAKRARKAEQSGQTFRAQGYWAQAEVRADTVVARYPESSWADDAQLIRGEAMVSRGDCVGAIPALEQATLSTDSPEVVEQAQVLLGRCRLAEGNLAAADRAFVSLLESPDTAVRHAAQWQHARILRMNGDCPNALIELQDLEGLPVERERAACYAILGDLPAARPLIEAALTRQDTALAWAATLAGVGRIDPSLASAYTSAAVAIPGLQGERRDQLLIDDGIRMLYIDADSGLARFGQAAAANPITNGSLEARLRIANFILSQTDTLPGLEAARPVLDPLSEFGGKNAISAINYLRVLDRVQVYIDSVSPGAPQGDLATFVLAESIRDVLPAPWVAAQLFAAVPALWPTSPYAPKALLALAAMRPDEVESIVHTLECIYPESPYLLLVAGVVTPEVLALEDSLQLFAGGAPAGRAPGVRRAPPAAAAGQRDQDELN